jgi:hypothetical protein
MAAIAFNGARQAEQAGERLKTVLTLLRRMLDAFVSYRMRLAASEADMPADKPATVNAQFQPLDPGVVSEAIPAFGAGGADARLATVRRFCISALMVVAAGLALVAITALKIIAYLPRFH